MKKIIFIFLAVIALTSCMNVKTPLDIDDSMPGNVVLAATDSIHNDTVIFSQNGSDKIEYHIYNGEIYKYNLAKSIVVPGVVFLLILTFLVTLFIGIFSNN